MSVDPPDVSAKLIAAKGFTFPFLADTERAAIRAYGVEDVENEIAWPSIIVVESAPGGPRFAWTWYADEFRKRIPASEVLAAVRALPAPPPVTP